MKHILALTGTTALTALAYNSSGDQGATITTPVGRIVWGHPLKPRQKINKDTKQAVRDASGNPVMETSFGLAIPVADFQAAVWPVMAAEAAKGYPNGAPGKFSWKITQPQEIDPAGKPYGDREGYAGHVVLAVSTTLEPPAAFQWNGAQWQQMQPDAIKCGDYVQVEINFKVNVPTNTTHTPSLYVNPRQIAFVGYGTEIVSAGFTADPNAAFGAGPAALPAGASATPLATAGGGSPAMPGNGSVAAVGGMPAATMPNAATAAPGVNAMPSTPVSAPPPAAPGRPVDPAHIHDNGNGTEQWFVNGAWDGQAHPVAVAAPATLPPPAAGFVAAAAGMPGAPVPAAGGMPMPGAMPPR